MQRTPVYIVGMGVVSSLGNTVEGMWQNLLKGVSGVGLNTFHTYRRAVGELSPAFDALKELVTAEAKEFNPLDWMDRKMIRREDPFCWFALAAAVQAMKQANFSILPDMRNRTGVVIGTGIGGLMTLEEEHTRMLEKGPDRVSPFLVTRLIANGATSIVARHFNANGPAITPISACATGADAIGQGLHLIRSGEADVVIAGGTEAAVTPLALSGFRNMEALAKRNDNPTQRSRPFDRDRDGFVLSEGAGIVVLTSRAFAEYHGLTPIVEVAGHGQTQDSHHITAPHPEGLHASRAIQFALADARITPDEVVYINPHGTSTPTNDPIETLAIRRVFGKYTPSIPLSSSKAMLGHMMGAAGAVEAIICAMTLRDGLAHPSVNLDNVDEKCTGLGHIFDKPQKIRPGAAVSTSLGFGGANSALVFLPV